jgi:hypothetical protein
MRDPVERMVEFIQQQKQQAAAEHARTIWARRLLSLLPCVEEVVEVFRRGLEEVSNTPLVSVHVDPKNDQRSLVILFQPRDGETGASAVFRCRQDGIVCGVRYPFHDVLQAVRPEHFADLGEPATVHAHRLGNAVVDFLEWASVGEGCGRRKLRFWSPPAAAETGPGAVRLAIVTDERAAA